VKPIANHIWDAQIIGGLKAFVTGMKINVVMYIGFIA
jgi:hypothetical protein